MLSVFVVWNIFWEPLRCPSSVSTWHGIKIGKNITQPFQCCTSQRKSAVRDDYCIPDFKFTLQMNLILQINLFNPLNSTIALFTACTSLDYIQGWIVLWIVHCTERDCHTFRWVSSAGTIWLQSPSVDTFLSLSGDLDLSWVVSMFWVKSLGVRAHCCELLGLHRLCLSDVTYLDFGLGMYCDLFSLFPPYSWRDILEVQNQCLKTWVTVLWAHSPLPPWEVFVELNFCIGFALVPYREWELTYSDVNTLPLRTFSSWQVGVAQSCAREDSDWTLGKNVFTMRVGKHWNRLLSNAPSLSVFRTHLVNALTFG